MLRRPPQEEPLAEPLRKYTTEALNPPCLINIFFVGRPLMLNVRH